MELLIISNWKCPAGNAEFSRDLIEMGRELDKLNLIYKIEDN